MLSIQMTERATQFGMHLTRVQLTEQQLIEVAKSFSYSISSRGEHYRDIQLLVINEYERINGRTYKVEE